LKHALHVATQRGHTFLLPELPSSSEFCPQLPTSSSSLAGRHKTAATGATMRDVLITPSSIQLPNPAGHRPSCRYMEHTTLDYSSSSHVVVPRLHPHPPVYTALTSPVYTALRAFHVPRAHRSLAFHVPHSHGAPRPPCTPLSRVSRPPCTPPSGRSTSPVHTALSRSTSPFSRRFYDVPTHACTPLAHSGRAVHY